MRVTDTWQWSSVAKITVSPDKPRIECFSIGKHQVVTNPELVFKPISENLYHENT